MGSSRINCRDGKWDNSLPFCYKTSNKKNFDESLPAEIQYHVADGGFVRGLGGELFVTIGSHVTLDCVFSRKKGTPEWSWSINNSSQDFMTGWATSDQDWLYRLELANISSEESGNYNCTTQRGYSNTLKLRLSDDKCGKLPKHDGIVRSNLPSNVDNFVIGTRVEYTCPPGYDLQGEADVYCREDGTWSGGAVSCLGRQCSPLEIASPHLRLLSLNNSFSGLATFDCPFGYRLTGKKSIQCQADGGWSGLVPGCEAILCPSPSPPLYGEIMLGSSDNGYYVGSSVQWKCDAGHVMVGEPITTCTHLGMWSDATPSCMLACRYPGSPHRGLITPVKFVYNIGETVMVLCDQGYTSVSNSTLVCTHSGEWSDVIPQCVDIMEI